MLFAEVKSFPRIQQRKRYDLNQLVGQVNLFDLGFLIGRFASDGSIGDNRLVWLFSFKEADIIPLIRGQLEVFHPTLRARRDSVLSLVISSKILKTQAVDSCLKHQCPDTFWEDDLLLRGWAQGMFDGDGGISRQKNRFGICVGNTSEGLIESTERILQHFGINYGRSDVQPQGNRQVLKRLDLHRGSHKRFVDLIGFRSAYKVQLTDQIDY